MVVKRGKETCLFLLWLKLVKLVRYNAPYFLQRKTPTSPGSEAEGGEDAVVLELCESYKCGEGNSWLAG